MPAVGDRLCRCPFAVIDGSCEGLILSCASLGRDGDITAVICSMHGVICLGNSDGF